MNETARRGVSSVETMDASRKGLHYILGGAFMIVVGALATAALAHPGYVMGVSLALGGLLAVGYGVWLRR